jgi:hypothetical protein
MKQGVARVFVDVESSSTRFFYFPKYKGRGRGEFARQSEIATIRDRTCVSIVPRYIYDLSHQSEHININV